MNTVGDVEDLSGIKVSVIIPVYNCGSYIAGAVESVGTDHVAEILVVDDGSTDDTVEFAMEVARSNPLVRVIADGRLGGAGPTRNLGIKESSSPLVAFLDADDRWRPGKLAAQVAAHAANPRVGMSFTDYMQVSMDGEILGTGFSYWPLFSKWLAGRRGRIPVDMPLARIYAENPVGTSTVVARRDLLLELGGFPLQYGNAEDWPFWMTLAGAADVVCLNEDLLVYLMHRPGGATATKLMERHDAMLVCADRFRAEAYRQARWSVPPAYARVAVARSEALAAGSPFSATFWMAMAFLRQPSRRHLRETFSLASRAARIVIGYFAR